MKKLCTAVALLMMVLPSLIGCGRVRYPTYYTINLPAPPDPAAPEGVRNAIAVREFQSPNYLRQGPIVYRPTPEQIGFYEYHRWASDPRGIVTSAVLDHLRASGNFSLVSKYDGHADVDYILSGRLEKLEEVDDQTGVKVEVAMSAQITSAATGATLWSNSVSEVEPVSQRSVSGVVAQMNRNTEQAISKLLSTTPALVASSKH